MDKETKNIVIVQKWEESERGWGSRPDGYSLHLTEEHRVAYIKAYWDRMPDEPPDEYSRPDGSLYEAEIPIEVYEKVIASKNGIRIWDNEYPGGGGTDGWRHPK